MITQIFKLKLTVNITAYHKSFEHLSKNGLRVLTLFVLVCRTFRILKPDYSHSESTLNIRKRISATKIPTKLFLLLVFEPNLFGALQSYDIKLII